MLPRKQVMPTGEFRRSSDCAWHINGWRGPMKTSPAFTKLYIQGRAVLYSTLNSSVKLT